MTSACVFIVFIVCVCVCVCTHLRIRVLVCEATYSILHNCGMHKNIEGGIQEGSTAVGTCVHVIMAT